MASNAEPIRVFILEDEGYSEESMVNEINKADDMILVGTCRVLEEAVDRVLEIKPDVVLIDVIFAGVYDSDGIVEFERMKKKLPDLKGIVVSGYGESKLVKRAFTAGVRGYIRKTDPRALVGAIRKVWYDDDVALEPGMERYLADVASEKPVVLTERQREVLVAYAQGLMIKEIAAKLEISEGTVKEHVRVLKDKTGLCTKGELIIWAIRNGYLRVAPA